MLRDVMVVVMVVPLTPGIRGQPSCPLVASSHRFELWMFLAIGVSSEAGG
jgi:hypothetical protein